MKCHILNSRNINGISIYVNTATLIDIYIYTYIYMYTGIAAIDTMIHITIFINLQIDSI